MAPSYAELLLRHAASPALAGFRWQGGAILAWDAPVRTLSSWADLRRPGPWLISLPYAFPALPGRAWDATRAVRWSDPGETTAAIPPPRALAVRAQWDAAGHMARVRETQAAIADGLVYQLNLGCRWELELAPGPHPDLGLHLALLASDPARYAGVFRGGDGPALVGNSPELFLEARAGELRSCPIKGTRQRIPGHEAASRAALDGCAKERAELAMIVDLVRNDLSRVAAIGGVRVDDPGSVFDLPRLHHRVATVSARLAPGRDLVEALAAAFPAGSITGAPKRAAMAHIARLEGADRGAWCGAYGLLDGDACILAVAIRTVEIAGTALVLRAGGGIVADSDPEAEWHEARAKAQGIAMVLGAVI